MKKLLLVLVALLGISLSSMGQTASCKISGGAEGATVVASITSVGDGFVMVSAENDGSFDVNVTVEIYRGNIQVGTTSAKVRHDQTATIKVPTRYAKSSEETHDYTIKVKGTRCN